MMTMLETALNALRTTGATVSRALASAPTPAGPPPPPTVSILLPPAPLRASVMPPVVCGGYENPPPPFSSLFSHAARRLSRIPLSVLPCLLLLTGLSAGAQAQTVSMTSSSSSGAESESVQVTASFNTGDRHYSYRWGIDRANTTATYSTSGPDYAVGNTKNANWNPPNSQGNWAVVNVSSRNITSEAIWLNVHDDSADEPDETIVVRFQFTNLEEGKGSFTYTIEDDDPTVVSLTRVGSATAIDEGGKVEFTVTLGRALVAGEVIDAPLSIGGTGVTTGDWSLAQKSGAANTGITLLDAVTATPKVRFSGAGAQTATLELTALPDGTSDSGETFSIGLGADSAFDAAGLGTNVGGGADPHGSNNAFSVTVNADDGGPGVPTADLELYLGASPLPEGASVIFSTTLSRALAADETVTLALAVGGTATRGTDYRLSCDALTGFAGAVTCNGIDSSGPSITLHGAHWKGRTRFSGPLRLEAIKDGTAESPETVTLSLGGGRTETLTLNDAPSSVNLSFFRDAFSWVESGGLHQPALQVDAAPGGDIELTLVFTDITATAGADYVKSTTVTYPADGTTRNSLDIPLQNDTLCEGDETFRVEIDASSLPSWVTLGSQGSTVLTIEDDDCTVTVAGGNAVVEGEDARFAVRVNPVPVNDLAIGYGVSEDAGNAREFVALGDKGTGRTVTVPAGRASADVTVPTVQAAGIDVDGHVTVTLDIGDQYTLGSPSSATVRVFDEIYTTAHVNFTGVAGSAKGPLHAGSGDGTWTVSEGVGTIWLEMELSEEPRDHTTVYVREKGSGTTATRGADYERPSLGWTGKFSTSRRARFKVPIVDDGIGDDRETLTLEIYSASSATSQFNRVVGTTTVHGNTVDTHDFRANTGALGTYEITIRDYTSNAIGDDVGVWLSADVYEVTEGSTLEAAVHLEEPRGADTVISVTDTGGTAGSGTDYTAGPYSVTVPAGSTSGTFTIPTAQDGELEMDEGFRIRIDAAALPDGFVAPNGTGTPEEVSVTINDDEYTLCFAQRSYSFREDEDMVMVAQFSRPLPEGGRFKFTYTDRTASGGVDYTPVNVFPDFFWLPAGTEEYTLRIPIAEDTLYENNELFHVMADVPALPDGYNTCGVDALIKDISREVDFVAAAYTAHEGRAAEVAVRVVERDSDNLAKLRKPVTLHVADSGTGTATSGTDYAAGPWTLTIPAGASRGVLRIPVHADAVSDDEETIDLAIWRAGTGTSGDDRRLLGADGAVSSDNLHVRARDVTDMANGAATVTIRNASEAPWGAPVISIEAGPQVSEGSEATFTLKADPPPLAPLDVSIHVGETDVSHDLADPFSGIRTHLAEGDLGIGTAMIDTTGSTVFTVPTRTNGAANSSTVRVVLMDPSLLFGDGEADYTVGRPTMAYVGVDAATPEFEAQRSAVAVVPTEPVRNLRVTAIDATSAEASWDAVPHATAYRLEWEGGSGGDYIGGGSNGVTGTTRTIYHNAPAAMTLTVRVTPTSRATSASRPTGRRT